MDVPRKPLAKSNGRQPLRSGVVVQWHGTPPLDNRVAVLVNGGRSERVTCADHPCERRVKGRLRRGEGFRAARSPGSHHADAPARTDLPPNPGHRILPWRPRRDG
jgi:hypothetical protein